MNGLVVVDKPAGITSHDVVARVRRLAGTRKVGHAGTLDPMATGVLVVGINRATRLLGHLLLTDKAYDATVRLGVSTTTDDAEGEVLATTPAAFHQPGLVEAEFAEQVGEIMQVPTAVSAIKVDGKRAYQRVRDGEEVELKPRPVTIHSLQVLDQRVVDELDAGHVPYPELLADLGADHPLGRLERSSGTGQVGLATPVEGQHGVEDRGLLGVSGDPDVGDRDEPEPRVLDPALEHLRRDDLDPVGDLADTW